mmetsp:Transcript_21239/g.58059  ORF Transcript_21239/g.58059 Transcript_21239/m.58059 type:complete len:230 (+) Transcript_21239:629-1318(+)
MDAIAAGMRTGQTGSDLSLRCLSNSQPKKSAKTLLSFVCSHAMMRWLHSGRHCRNSAGATSMMLPKASMIVCRKLSSWVSESSSSSSSSCCNSGGAPAVSALFAVLIAAVLLKESSMKLKNFCTNPRISWALSTPGPQFFTHSPMPSAASRRVSGSSSLSMQAMVLGRNVRRRSAATPLLAPSAAVTHLMSNAQTWEAVPRASSYSCSVSSVGLRIGKRASAVGCTASR